MRVGSESEGTVNGHAANTVSPRLVQAAQEFEAQMMKELLKPMTGQDDDGGGDGATGALGEFASEALGQAISRNGGFGIAGRIVQELSRSGHFSPDGNSSGRIHENNSIETARY